MVKELDALRKLRDKVYEEMLYGKISSLKPLLKQMRDARVSKVSLARTGISNLLFGSQWPECCKQQVIDLKEKWKLKWQSDTAPVTRGAKHLYPFRGVKPKEFLEQVSKVMTQLKMLENEREDDMVYKRVAVCLASLSVQASWLHCPLKGDEKTGAGK